MPKKNKIYWFEGVTERGVKALLNDEYSKFSWLRSQRNRRLLVVLMGLGLALVALGSYWPIIETDLELSSAVTLTIYHVTVIFAVLSVIGGYLLLRISVRGLADAPDELLDERQIKVRNSSFRYAYMGMGYLVLALIILMFNGPELKLFAPEGNDGSLLFIATLFTFSYMPSMVLAWNERDI